MDSRGGRKRKGTSAKPTRGLSKQRLAELVDEATIDAYGEAEQATGFYTMMEDQPPSAVCDGDPRGRGHCGKH